jgi:phosphopantetheine--protein transferase-like protein
MIGIDLVFIPEFEKQLETGGRGFMEKAFLTSEMKNRKTEHLAGLWAAKEAVAKASTQKAEKWTDIVISRNAEGKPKATFLSEIFEISIAHHGDYAVAVAHRLDA